MAAMLLRDISDVFYNFCVLIQRPMGKIQSGAVDAASDELLQHFRISGGWADSYDDLGFTHGDRLTETDGKDN